MSTPLTSPARAGIIVDELRTLNGHLVEQTVRVTDNRSLYKLRGVDMVDDAIVGTTAVQVRTMAGGTARRVTGP